MAKILLVIFFNCISWLCFAQQLVETFTISQADSLKKEMDIHTPEDSVRAHILDALATAFLTNDPGQAESYCRQGLAISLKVKWVKGIVNSYQILGSLAVNSGDNIKALEYYHKCLSAAELLKSDALTAHVKTNMALIYLQTGEYDKAITLFKESASVMHAQKDTYLESVSLLNAGLAYFRKNDFSNAIAYLNRSFDISQKYDYAQVSAYALSNKGAAYNQMGKFDSGLLNFKNSIGYSDKAGDQGIKSESLNGIAESNMFLKKYSDAEKYITQSMAISKALSLVQYQKEGYQMLSDIYKEQKKYKESLEAYKQYITLRDSAMNEDKKSEITRQQMQYDFDKKETLTKAANDKKQVLAAAEISKQKIMRNASIGIGSILVLVAFTIIILYKRRKDALERKKTAEFNLQVADTEMKALRAQMNPHFIFNSLNSINDYIDKNDTAKATLYTTRFAKLMRMILENSEQKEIPLADDLEALELYMQLERMRMPEKFSYRIIVDEDIDRENTLIPPLILQPFVENSILHGISKKQGEGKILIHIQKQGDMINCIVEDNGIGRIESANIEMQQDTLHKKSFGMKITKARIDIINKLKKSNAAITFSDLEEGTKIEVKLPEALAF